MAETNPFATPQTTIAVAETGGDPRKRLASRWSRLGAACIDIAIAVIFGLTVAIAFTGSVPWRDDDYIEAVARLTVLQTLLMNALGMGFFLAIHGYLLANYGQTIGKAVLGLRIVNQYGEIPKFLPMFGLRYVTQWAVSYIPRIGSLLILIDMLVIFGKERRCLHDHVAGTWVIRIRGSDDQPQPLKALKAGN